MKWLDHVSAPYAVGLSDHGTLNDVTSGKRGLRKDVSDLSVGIAGLQRDDAIRTVKLAAKQQFAALVFSQVRLRVVERVLEKKGEDGAAGAGSV